MRSHSVAETLPSAFRHVIDLLALIMMKKRNEFNFHD